MKKSLIFLGSLGLVIVITYGWWLPWILGKVIDAVT